MDMLGSGFQRIKSSIIAREQMQNSITGNIANADTPNYRADQRDFAAFLSDQQPQRGSSDLMTTNTKHFSTSPSARLPGSVFEQDVSRKMDGNSVDIQTEMARMSENQLMHELSLKLIKGKLSGMLNAIKEGR